MMNSEGGIVSDITSVSSADAILSAELHHSHDLADARVRRTEQLKDYNRRTKIICTMGPAEEKVETIVELIKAGMNVARFNFSHGDHTTHKAMLDRVRDACTKAGKHVATMLDTKGPEIRTGLLVDGQAVTLKAGQELDLVFPPKYDPQSFQADGVKTLLLDYPNAPRVLSPGKLVKIADGLIVCTVLSCHPDECRVHVRVNNSGKIGQRKNVNLAGTEVDLPAVTEKDKADLRFAVEQKFDCIAASFTRNADAVREIRQILTSHGEHGKDIKIICKIENHQGLDNFDEILAEADGIMVARGDLGVEIPIQKVCMAQKMMIRKCNLVGKPVITATQMLESMIENPRPTRAEATDVANAVFDGSDCVMLSGETAAGAYPVQAVTMMARICRTTELSIDYQSAFQTIVHFTKKPIKRAESITSAAVKASIDLDASCIIVLTESGSSARYVSKYKPQCPVVVVTPKPTTALASLLSRGLYSVVVDPSIKTHDELVKHGLTFARQYQWVKTGDQCIVVSGIQMGVSGGTNMVQIIDVPE